MNRLLRNVHILASLTFFGGFFMPDGKRNPLQNLASPLFKGSSLLNLAVL